MRWMSVVAVLCLSGSAHAGYSIDRDSSMTRSWQYSVSHSSLTWTGVLSCLGRYTNGVVRKWSLKERNLVDFRSSSHFCRNMLVGGGLAERTADRMDHFSYTGSGTSGYSQIPLDRLPVGVEILSASPGRTIPMYRKLKNIRLLHHSAGQIRQLSTGHTAASWALNRSSGHSDILKCLRGYVMTGVKIAHKNQMLDPGNQREIFAVQITCHRLRYTR